MNLDLGHQLEPGQVRVTRADLVRYAGASGDFNPIHWSDRHAHALGLDGVIAHGLWTMGQAVSFVQSRVGDHWQVVDAFTRFTRPVVVPDDDAGATVDFAGQVTEVTDDLVTISVDARCGEHKILGAAKVQVRHV